MGNETLDEDKESPSCSGDFRGDFGSDIEDVLDIDNINDSDNVLSKYDKRRLHLFNSWERNRPNLLKAYSNSVCPPLNVVCSLCSAPDPEYRCLDCAGMYFCLICVVEKHRTAYQLHVPEKL